MEGTFDGRRFGAAASMAGALTMTSAAIALGCAGPAAQPVTSAEARHDAPGATATPARTDTDQAQRGEDEALREAQHAWCVYLQALYLRADGEATRWPMFEQCEAASSAASPTMLRETAECSLRALERFVGDPFTPAYAAEVSRCGAAAIDATALPSSEVAPYVSILCDRIATCGEVDGGECRARLTEGLGPHLCRAIGAMNERSRTQLRACFHGVSCEAIGDQINGCVEPIMESLLWLPR